MFAFVAPRPLPRRSATAVSIALIATAALGLVAGLVISADPAHAADPAKDLKPIQAAPVKFDKPVDFEKDVYPILEANCVACHNVGIAESKLCVENVEAIRKGGKRGPAIVPKNPDASLLFQLASRAKHPAMPPLPNKVEANPLTPKELGILKQWILEGAAGGAGGPSDTIQWQPIPADMKSILSVAMSPWGRYVAAGRANQIVVYDVILGEEVARLVDPALAGVQFEGRPMYPNGAADRDFVHALAFSPDESLLAAGGYRVVKLWKRPRNVQKWAVTLPDVPTALAVSPDRALIAVATADKTIQLFNATSGAPIRKFPASSAAANGLQFSADGKTLYGGSTAGTWSAWNMADGAAKHIVARAPVNAILLSGDSHTLLTAGADGIIRAWSLPLSTQQAGAPRELKGHAKAVTALALIPGAASRFVSGGEDGTLRIWDLTGNKQVAKLDHGGPVTAVAVRPDGVIIASSGVNKVTRIWQAGDGKRLAEMKGDQVAQRALAMRADAQTIAGQHVATDDARVKAVEQELKERQESQKKAAEAKTAAQKALADVQAKEKAAAGDLAAAKKAAQAKPADAALKMKVEAAEKALAAAAPNTKAATEGLAAAVRADETAVKAVQIAEQHVSETKSQKAAAEAARTQTDKAFAEAKAASAARELPIRTVAFSADGKTVATAGDDASLQLWDAATGRPLECLVGHAAPVASLAYGTKSVIVSAGRDKTLIAWETSPPWALSGRIGTKPESPLDLSGSPFVGRVLALDFSRDGKLLATGGGEPTRSGELKIWNVPSLSLARDLKEAHSDTVLGVEFSRDGRYLASGGADKFLKVFDVAAGKLTRSFEGHTHHVLDVSWKADGSTLASGGADSQIKVWNFETGEQARSIAGYAKQVTSIQFVGTGDDVVSCGGDKTVHLHRSNDGGNIRTFEGGTDYMYSAAAARDESTVVAGGEDGVLRVWSGSDGKSLMIFGPPKPGAPSAQANAAKR